MKFSILAFLDPESCLMSALHHIANRTKKLPPLRVGMSVVVNVSTGHVNGLPRFLTSLFGTTPKNG